MTVKGTIKAISGSVVQVGNDTTEQWFVKMPGEAQQIDLVGKAQASWLKPGLMVRFIASFDAKGKAQEPVHKLDIITLRRPKQGELPELPGLYPTTAFGAGAAAAAAGAGFGEKPAPGAAKEQGGPLKVIGQLTAIKNQGFAVSTGQMLVRGELKDDAEIKVDIADYRWMQVGDAIEAHGWYYPQLPGQVQANRVTITAAQPLGSAPAEKTLSKPEAKTRPETRPKGRVKSKVKEADPLPF
jgi:ribosomal protein S16